MTKQVKVREDNYFAVQAFDEVCDNIEKTISEME